MIYETNNILRKKYTSLHKKFKFSIKDFFSKCDQIRYFLWIWSHLLKKSLMENFIFCAVRPYTIICQSMQITVWRLPFELVKISIWLSKTF